MLESLPGDAQHSESEALEARVADPVRFECPRVGVEAAAVELDDQLRLRPLDVGLEASELGVDERLRQARLFDQLKKDALEDRPGGRRAGVVLQDCPQFRAALGTGAPGQRALEREHVEDAVAIGLLDRARSWMGVRIAARSRIVRTIEVTAIPSTMSTSSR